MKSCVRILCKLLSNQARAVPLLSVAKGNRGEVEVKKRTVRNKCETRQPQIFAQQQIYSFGPGGGFVVSDIGLWASSSSRQSSTTNMAHNNLQHNPESINSDGKSGRRKYWPGNECEVMDSGWGIGTTRDRWSSSDRVIETPRSGIKWGRATNRVRISNIGPTYLFIGLLLLLQSSYLCHGEY